MSLQAKLVAEIEAYTKAAGVAETTFGRLAVNDGKFVGRLRAGKGVTLRVIETAQQYMREHPVSVSPKEKTGAAA